MYSKGTTIFTPEPIRCLEVEVASQPRDITAIEVAKGKDAREITAKYPLGHFSKSEEVVVLITLNAGPQMITKVSVTTRNVKSVRVQLDPEADESNPDVSLDGNTF